MSILGITSGESGTTWATSVSTLSFVLPVLKLANRFIIVGINIFNSASAQTVSGVNCNGSAMTKLDSITASLESAHQDMEIWYFIGPGAFGAQIDITFSASVGFVQAQGIALYGIDQSTPIDSHTIGQSLVSVASFAQACTIVSANATQVGFCYQRSAGTLSAGSGTAILQNANSGAGCGYTTATNGLPGTGSHALNWNISSNATFPGAATIGLLGTGTYSNRVSSAAIGTAAELVSATAPYDGAARTDPPAAYAQKSSMPLAAGAWYGISKNSTMTAIRFWSPAAAATHVSGTVTENGTPVAKTVRLYDHLSGDFLGETISDLSTGAYSIPSLGRTKVVAIAFDSPSFNALVYDCVIPV